MKDYNSFALSMKALSNETRMKIIDMISYQELCVCSIIGEFNITQPTLSYHMKILCESGLVNSRKDGVWTMYSLDKENFKNILDFINNITYKIYK